MLIILLSGPIGVGKSTLCAELVKRPFVSTMRSGRYLSELAASRQLDGSRASLQTIGDELDSATNFSWIVDQVAVPTIKARPDIEVWILDSVRKREQVDHFKRNYPGVVLHVHLWAPESMLRERYERRLNAGGEYEGLTPYECAVLHPNETSSRSLASTADLRLDVTEMTLEEMRDAILGP